MGAFSNSVRREPVARDLRAAQLAALAVASLIDEARLSPKPGLVDSRGSGAHGDLDLARRHWESARVLLPSSSQQYAAVGGRITELSRQIDARIQEPPPPTRSDLPWWRRGAAGLVSIGLLLLGKLKFLLLGLTKASTFISMFAFFGVYWSIYD